MKLSFTLFPVCFLLITSCLETNSSFIENEPFVENLKKLYPKLKVQTEILPVNSSVLNVTWLLPLDSCELMIVVDDADKTLKLMDFEGHIFSEVGGEGRGPEEFKSIINPYIDQNNRLFIIDGILFRITEYEIEDKNLNFIKSTQFNYPTNYHLSSIYVNEYGRFGVFTYFESYFKPDNRYLLYRLNENFEIIERLLEIPGNERPKYEFPEFTMFLDNIFAERTYWDLEGEWFYYIRSHYGTIKTYNLSTGEIIEINLEIGERENSNNDIITFMKQKLDHVDDYVDGEQYWAVLEKGDLLPIFWEFSVNNNNLLMPLFFPNQKKGIVILIDMNEGEIFLFNAPHGLERFSICNQIVYGINFVIAEGNRQITLMQLDF